MQKLLTSLELTQRGFHAFRHFNVSLLDALRVPLKVIQERLGHAFKGSFTLDVYGGQAEWKANVEAAQKLGAAIEEVVQKEKQTAQVDSFDSLTTVQENGSQSQKLEAV